MIENKKINAVIIGASGYTGAELVRLLAIHPNVEISALVAESNVGKSMSDIYPHFSNIELPELEKLTDVNFTDIDVAFCCLPHGTSQEIISNLYREYKHLKIIDLSADFRIINPDNYKKWYGKAHIATDIQSEAVYGLTEIYRDKIKNARLVACPGCYPTSILLPLIPLLAANKIVPKGIIADSKSGISGAGRKAAISNLFCEVDGNIQPYGLGGHRHVAEIDQELEVASGAKIEITFTPQVVPMKRGILSCIYVELVEGRAIDSLRNILVKKYLNEPFVHMAAEGVVPSTSRLSGSNSAYMNIFADRVEGRAIIISAIDNLLKGASGQAVQNMNLMFDIPESTGLMQLPVFP